MKILYDHQIFSLQKFGGISRYFVELINYFDENKILDYELKLNLSENYYLENNDLFKNEIIFHPNSKIELLNTKKSFDNFFKGINFKGKAKLYELLKIFGYDKPINEIDINQENKKESIKKLSEKKFDIFHPTYYDNYFLEYIGNKPYVLTIHDMTHEVLCEKYPFFKNDMAFKRKQLIAEKCSKIIAISNNTKKDIINFYNIDDSKIDVVYHGDSLKPYTETIDLTIPEKYLLFVGNRTLYKNFYFFVHSIAELIKKETDLYIICAGGDDFNREELFFIDNLNIGGKILYIKIDDKILSCLYKNAIAFIFPSLYEGFGIPILESFACGCPMVLSNTSCFPEIAEDAAIYFDPEKEESIRDSIIKILHNNNLRKEMVEKGFKRLKFFDWQKTSEETKKVYEKILE